MNRSESSRNDDGPSSDSAAGRPRSTCEKVASPCVNESTASMPIFTATLVFTASSTRKSY